MVTDGLHARAEVTNNGPLGASGQHGRAQILSAFVSGQHARAEVTSVVVVPRALHARAELLSAGAFPVNVQHARAELATPVSVKAGADVLNVEPGSVVTLTGSGGDGGDPVWVQVLGAPATTVQDGVNLTLRAPATLSGDTLTFRFSVDGAYDDVFVTVLPALESVWNGVRWVPRTRFPVGVL